MRTAALMLTFVVLLGVAACSPSAPEAASTSTRAHSGRDRAEADAVSGTTTPAASGCPGTGSATSPLRGSAPWIRDRYGLSPLIADGHGGQGISVVVVAEASADAGAFASFAACYGVTVALQQSVFGGGALPAPGIEPTLDVQSVVIGAPNLASLQLVVEGSGGFGAVAQAIAAGTYGHVDIVTYSYATCLSKATGVSTTSAAISSLVSAGTWVLASAGDAGSTACTPKGACANPAPTLLDVNYPAADPDVLAVGGTQLLPDSSVDVVWNAQTYAQASGGTTTTTASSSGTGSLLGPCAGGGGGAATTQPLTPPSWQAAAGRTTRGVPDVAGLAGAPGAEIVAVGGADWFNDGGTSLASPLTAGGLASVRSALRAAGVDVQVPIAQALWALGGSGSPALTDVTSGTNDLYGLGCCTAGAGYDEASGWGTLQFAALVGALQAAPGLVGPASTTPTSSGSSTSTSSSTTAAPSTTTTSTTTSTTRPPTSSTTSTTRAPTTTTKAA
ncbi:MAG: hypothetical protein U0Q07_02905 [Acidimicrobiales bacterium]